MFKLNHIDTILLVKDIEKSRLFYTETLGLEIVQDWKTMLIFKEHFAILQADEVHPKEEICKFITPGQQGRGNTIIYFQSDDLEKCCTELKTRGVEFIHEIVQLPWERIFRIYDPDQYIIEIGEPH